MFVNAIYESAVEIEQKGRDGLRTGGPGDHTDAAVALCASAERTVTTMLHSSAAELPYGRASCVYVSCRSEMFLYPVRGIFREGLHRVN